MDTLDDMVEQAFNDQCTAANPRYPLMKENQRVILKSAGKGGKCDETYESGINCENVLIRKSTRTG